MPNYDLGTAHGRIKIDSDSRGIDDVVRNLDKLKAVAASLSSKFADTREKFSGFVDNLRKVSTESDRNTKTLRGLKSSVDSVATGMGLAVSRTMHFASTLSDLGKSGYDAAAKLDDLHSAITKFGSLGGILRGVVSHFSGMDEQLSNLPRWQREILKAGSAIAGLGVAASALGKAKNVARGFLLSTSAAAAIAPRLATARNGIRAMGFALGAAYPQLGHLATRLGSAGESARVFGQRASNVGREAAGFVRNLSSMVVGAAMVSKSLAGIGKAAKLAVTALGAVSAAAAGIQIIGTVALGAFGALKQLSGILLILPGALMSLGLAGGVAMVAMKGIKKSFEAMALEGDAFNDATKNMTPNMKDAAIAGQGLFKELKGLSNNINEAVWWDFGNQIRDIGEQYMPTLRQGSLQVAGGLNKVKNGFVDFLRQPATVSDLNAAFGMTSVMLGNLSKGVWPFVAALRDIGMVGMEVMTSFSGGIGGAASKFGNFIAEARKTGELKGWITGAIQGFKDLGTTVSGIGSGVATVFKAFGANGDNALERMSASAQKFSAAMKASSDGGGLEAVAGALKRMASSSFDALSEGLRQVVNVLKQIAPFAERMSAAFSGQLVTVFQVVGAAATMLAKGLSSISGMGSVVGTLLAIGVGLKAMMVLFSPIVRGVQLVAGAFMLLQGASGAVMKINTAMRTAAAGSGVMATGLAKVRTAMAGFMAAGGGITIAIMALVGVFMAMSTASENAGNYQQQLKDKTEATANSIRGFTSAFEEANGVMGKGVVDEAVSQFDDLKSKMDEVSEQGTGFWDDLAAEVKDTFNTAAGDSLERNANMNRELDKSKISADNAKNAMKELGISSEEAAAAFTGSEAEWSSFMASLQGVKGGEDLISWITPMRQGFLETKSAMDAITPAGVTLSNALKTIGDGAASSTDKLAALKSALQALGLMQSTAEEAAFAYQQKLRDMGDAATSAADPTAALGESALLLNGKLNPVEQNAMNLNTALNGMADAFQDAAIKGGDVHQMWADMQPALQKLSNDFDIPLAKIQEFAQARGIAPATIETILKVSGQDQVIGDLTEVATRAQQINGGTFSVHLESQAAVDALTAMGVAVQGYNSTTGQAVVTVNADQAVGILGTINGLLKNPVTPAPIPGPEVLPSVVPPPTPPVPGALPPIPGAPVLPSQTPAPLPPDPLAFVPMAGAPILPSQTPQPLPPLPSPPIPAPAVEVPQIPQVPPITITADPGPAIGAINDVSGQLQGGIAAWDGYAAGVSSAMANAVGACQSAASSAVAALSGAAGGAFGSGSALGAGFAAGIQSQVGAVAAAAAALAAAAAAPLPNSPAKIGPFSGTGWTPFRGAALAKGFAQGIMGGVGDVGSSSMQLAQAVDSALRSISSSWGIPITSAAGKYITDPSKSEAQLKAENDKKIADEAKAEARAKLKEEQQKAKKPPEDAPEEKALSAEEQAKSDAKDAEKARQDKMDAALKLLEDGNGTNEQVADAVNTVADNTDAKQDDVRAALNTIGKQDSSQIDVLNALDAIDRNIASQSDIETQDTLEQLKSSAMSRKGISAYDPMESASTDVPKDIQKVITDIFGLLESVESTAKGAGELVDLLVRGISDTDGITKAIDGFQGLASGVAGIADTVGGIIGTVANIAAAAGSLIPGVGAITAGISAVTGGVGQVNAIVDLVQQGFKIAGRVVGGLLSGLAGGSDGALYGNVRTLIDTNDKTIKRWSDANAMDKRSSSYGTGGTNMSESNAIKNLNIYQGPGTDPYQMADEMMFAVRAAGSGAYAE